MTNMVPQLGWQYLAFNVYKTSNVTAFGGYYATDTDKSYNQTSDKVYTSVYSFVDEPLLNYFTVGAQLATLTTVTEPFLGIVHEIEFFSLPLGLFQIHDQYTCNIIFIILYS